MDWFSEFLDKISSGKVEFTDETGKLITISISKKLIDMFKENQAQFIKVGADAFKDFLNLMYKEQDFDALLSIYRKLDNSTLLAMYKEDSIKLAELVKQAQEERELWIWFGKQIGTRIVFGALGALL